MELFTRLLMNLHMFIGTELYTNYSELLTTATPQNIHTKNTEVEKRSYPAGTNIEFALCATFGEDPTENYAKYSKEHLSTLWKKMLFAKNR